MNRIKLMLCVFLFISLCIVNRPVNSNGMSGGITENIPEKYRRKDDRMMSDISQNCCDPKMLIPGNPDIDPKIMIRGPEIDNGILIPIKADIHRMEKLSEK